MIWCSYDQNFFCSWYLLSSFSSDIRLFIYCQYDVCRSFCIECLRLINLLYTFAEPESLAWWYSRVEFWPKVSDVGSESSNLELHTVACSLFWTYMLWLQILICCRLVSFWVNDLSFRSGNSMAFSWDVRSGLIYIEKASLLLFLRIFEASVDLSNLTRGLGWSDRELYFPTW